MSLKTNTQASRILEIIKSKLMHQYRNTEKHLIIISDIMGVIKTNDALFIPKPKTNFLTRLVFLFTGNF